MKLLLEREGIRMNHKKLRRLYAEERLQIRRRGGRKRAIGTRSPEAIIARRAAHPLLCVSDNGTELTSTAILTWCQDR